MENRNIFENISCLDHRYSLSEKEAFEKLSAHLSEEAAVRSYAQAEAALIKAHLSMRGTLDDKTAQIIDKTAQSVTPDEVAAEEEKTQHNIRALVNVLKTKFSSDIQPLIHLGATSADILDTALSMRMRNVTHEVVLPELKALEKALCRVAELEAQTPQTGSTQSPSRSAGQLPNS